jgi:hypothetical protein
MAHVSGKNKNAITTIAVGIQIAQRFAALTRLV